MDTIKQANSVLATGIALLPDEAKKEFLASSAKDNTTFVNDAIGNACGMLNGSEERIALLSAYAVQEANRVVCLLWREELLTTELETEYRKLPKMKEVAEAYTKFEKVKEEEKEGLNKQMQEYANKQKEEDIFKAVINGMTAEQAEKEYEAYRKQTQQAMQQMK